jgi:hypothetical protein
MEDRMQELASKMRAIPLSVTGPEGHPDMRVAELMIRAAEAMREACISVLFK